MKSLYVEDLLNLVEGEEYNKYLAETIVQHVQDVQHWWILFDKV